MIRSPIRLKYTRQRKPDKARSNLWAALIERVSNGLTASGPGCRLRVDSLRFADGTFRFFQIRPLQLRHKSTKGLAGAAALPL